MKKQDVMDFLTHRGLQPIGGMLCGIEEGYPLTVTVKNKAVWELCYSVPVDRFKSYKKELNRELKPMGGGAAVLNKRFVVTLGIRGSDFEELYESTVGKIAEVLRQNGVAPFHSCAFCGLEDCDTAVFHDGLYQPVHNACFEQYAERTRGQTERNDLNGNYILGFVGGLLGAVVGVIPSILTIMLMEKIYALMFALIPMCIYYGYKLFKGKLNKGAWPSPLSFQWPRSILWKLYWS